MLTTAVIALLVQAVFDVPDKTPPVHSPSQNSFIYSFNVDGMLSESGKMQDSTSPYWWLNSGGVMNIKNGVGSTNFGDMERLSKWRILYGVSTPADTDQGIHPQNIFRLVTRGKWSDFSQSAAFRLAKYNLSSSENRNASNGVLFFMRYQDGDNLYYAGMRVDGTAVIKKKTGGTYYTLAQNPVFDGIYDRNANPNILPVGVWFKMKAVIETRRDQSVLLTLYLDEKLNGEWRTVAQAIDAPGISENHPIYPSGYAGIRGDFFDFEFKDFEIKSI